MDTGLTAHHSDIREWYDGYRFGDFDIFCPWDVMNHVNRLLLDSNANPAGYWGNTSDNAIIRSFVDLAGSSITKKLETLLSGGYIIEKIEDDLTYDLLHASEENLWTILYLTGYLTKSAKNAPAVEPLAEGFLPLRIPNTAMRGIFEKTIQKWFSEKQRNGTVRNYSPLFGAGIRRPLHLN